MWRETQGVPQNHTICESNNDGNRNRNIDRNSDRNSDRMNDDGEYDHDLHYILKE